MQSALSFRLYGVLEINLQLQACRSLCRSCFTSDVVAYSILQLIARFRSSVKTLSHPCCTPLLRRGVERRILKLLLVAVELMSIAVDLVFLLSTYAPWLLLQQLSTRALTYPSSPSSRQAAAAAHRQGSTGARTRARVNSCIEYYRDQATLQSASACRSVG
jgi:hypothetical protein